MAIHPTAIVDPAARLGAGVEVGPYAIVDGDVVVGDACRIGAHARLQGPLVLGERCEVGFSALLGGDPQVKGRAGPFGRARIGRRNVFREFAQVHRSMVPDGETVIGDDGYFMACSHVAHDCVVGDHVVVCNNSLLSGHVHVQDRAFISGNCAIHQFVRIGELSMVGGVTPVEGDVPPFGLVVGNRPTVLRGLNVVGLRRAGFPAEVRAALQSAYRTLFRSDLPLPERLAAVDAATPEVARLLAFVKGTKRSVIGFGGGRDDG